MPKVFLSYRRSDSQMVAGRLREWLLMHAGEGTVFRDKDSIGAGEDWMHAIRENLSGDVTVLALLGKNWADARGEQGRRRLDDPEDWNRQELELALKQGKRLIPVLIEGAGMPAETELPESLRPLVRLNALKLRDDDWEADCEKLLRTLGFFPGLARRAWLGAVAAVGLASSGAAWWWHRRQVDEVRLTERVVPKPQLSRDQVKQKLSEDQYRALELLSSDPARAKRMIDDNFGEVDEALQAFPDDLELHALAGYAAKNVFASTKGVLTPEARSAYLARARKSFEHVLARDPNEPSAINGLGNVLFYERRFDEAITMHQRAIQLTNDRYPAARDDLALVQRVRSGHLKFDP